MQSGNMADEETTFLRLSIPGHHERRYPAERYQGALAAGSLVDDRRSGIEAVGLRQSMVASQCTMRWAHSACDTRIWVTDDEYWSESGAAIHNGPRCFVASDQRGSIEDASGARAKK